MSELALSDYIFFQCLQQMIHHKPIRMVLSQHPLGSVSQTLNGVGVVVHVLLQDQVALQHQHGTLLVLHTSNKVEEEY